MREPSISAFIAQLIQRCPAIRSIWLMGARANEGGAEASVQDWHLVAFADPFTLARLRKTTDLHRQDVHVRIVTDGDRFEIPWGTLQSFGSLMSLDWRQSANGEAYYTEATWDGPSKDGNVLRMRRKAVRLWVLDEAMAAS